jgi:alkanesulfonate monooxygenase SsuD/methylene tetrahydromethanopterin reductase-like flavin-dependent oxidoreductase (luciferase family)
VQTAQAIATLDQLSGGRVTITVGAGFPNRSEVEYAASEVEWRRRFARLDDTVALWRRLWTADGQLSFAGEVLRLEHVPHCATPAQPGGPPIWLGGASPAALARAGRLYDGWLPYPPRLGDYGDGLGAVRAAAVRAGRDEGAVTAALFATVLVTSDPESGRAALADYTKVTYRLPLETVETIQLLVAGPPAYVRERLRAYVEAGARHVVCRVAALDAPTQRAQLELVRAALDGSA